MGFFVLWGQPAIEDVRNALLLVKEPAEVSVDFLVGLLLFGIGLQRRPGFLVVLEVEEL